MWWNGSGIWSVDANAKMQWQVWCASPPELHALSVHLRSIFQVSERFFCAPRHPKHALKPSQPPPELLHVSDSSHRRLLFVPLTAELWFVACADSLTGALSSAAAGFTERAGRPWPRLTPGSTWAHVQTRVTHICIGAWPLWLFDISQFLALKACFVGTGTHKSTHPHTQAPLSPPAWVPSPSLCLF